MSFQSKAQYMVDEQDAIILHEPSESNLEVMDPQGGSLDELLEVADPHSHDEHEHEHGLEVSEKPTPEVIEVVIGDLGAIPGAPDSAAADPVLEVKEPDPDEGKADQMLADENAAKKSKKSEKWDWESKGATGFVAWIKERFDTVPKHSGYDSAGLERAVSYLEKLDAEISKAMRLDLEGELDANKVEDIRAKIDDGIERLQDRLDKVKSNKKNKRKKSSEEEYAGFIKDAQKITGVKGIYIMAPLFASRIARICINGMVSAGHDIEDIYAKQVKKWKLTDREQAEVMQLLADMGYPLRQDRGFMPDEDVDTTSSDNFDYAANYKG